MVQPMWGFTSDLIGQALSELVLPTENWLNILWFSKSYVVFLVGIPSLINVCNTNHYWISYIDES